MRRLEDEMSFIKKHHELELDMLKEQIKSLDRERKIAVDQATEVFLFYKNISLSTNTQSHQKIVVQITS